MAFTHILDPYRLGERSELSQEYLVDLLSSLNTGMYTGKFKRVIAKGKIYSARFRGNCRLVFAEHEGTALILMAIFLEGQHDQYEQYLQEANERYKLLLLNGALCSPPTIVLPTATVERASAFSPPKIEIEEFVSYGSQLLCLSDEQTKAINVRLSVRIEGPAGAGKTVIAFQLLQQLAEFTSSVAQCQPILYLGPHQLVKELSRLWSALEFSSLEQRECVKFETVESLTQRVGQRFSDTVFDDWIKQNVIHLIRTEQIGTVLKKLAARHKVYGDQEEVAKCIYQEFKLMASFVITDQSHWHTAYTTSGMSYFSNSELLGEIPLRALKEKLIPFFMQYQQMLATTGMFDLNICCEGLPALNGIYSALIVDEAQLLPIAMTKWLADSHLPIALLGDPHQATSDATLTFLRLSQQLFRGINTVHLTGSYRVPHAVARCANHILQRKKTLTLGQKMHGAAMDVEFFSHRKEGDSGTVQWRMHDMKLTEELRQAAQGADTAFVVFSCADRERVIAEYKAILVFYPKEIQGLEYPHIVIVNPESCLAPVFVLEKKMGALKKDKSLVFEHPDEVVALNKMFVAITRAKARVTLVQWGSGERYTRDIKVLLGLESERVEAIGIPLLPSAYSSNWQGQFEKLIDNKNFKQAKAIWIERLRHDPAEFDKRYGSGSVVSTPAATRPVVAPTPVALSPAVTMAGKPSSAVGTKKPPLAAPSSGLTKSAECETFARTRKVAEQGDADAQFSLGVCYAEGCGITKDEHEAFALYRKAAVQGHADAQFNLGCCYANGSGIAQDDLKAVAWYRKAAEQGDADAQFNLGVHYTQGLGIAQDECKAVIWFHRAANQGHVAAQVGLGMHYFGIAQDYPTAIVWFRKASEQGDAEARRWLAMLEGLPPK